MKIYFEDGELMHTSTLPEKPDHLCDAKHGYSNNKVLLNYLRTTNKDCVLYTNSLVALSNSYSWNDDLKRPEIYMRENLQSEFKNIQKLYKGKIRFSQNVEAMYKAGCFGCIVDTFKMPKYRDE